MTESEEIKLPEIGEGRATGVVLDIKVTPGDSVAKDDPILQIETDKATVDVPCPRAGTVEEVLVAEGDEIESGHPLIRLGPSEEGEEGDSADQDAENAEQEESDREQRDASPQDAEEEKKKEPETEKEPPSARRSKGGEESGEQAEDEPEPQEAQGEAAKSAATATSREHGLSDGDVEEMPTDPGPQPLAAPSVRALARELGVALDEIAATGEDGRVTPEDVKSHVRQLVQEGRKEASQEREHPSLPDFSRWGEVEKVPASQVRRATARHVSQSWELVPHVTHFDQADLTHLERTRTHLRQDLGDDADDLTLTAVVIAAVARALHRFPRFNASFDPERSELLIKSFINISVAVDSEDGLLVPVLHDVGHKGLLEIASELREIVEKARSRSLGREQLEGATFSLTNLGPLGGEHFTPLVTWPQVAVLGLGALRSVPVVDDGGDFVSRQMLPLSLSYDHRAVDGADATRFLGWIRDSLQEPLRLAIPSSAPPEERE